MIGGDALFTSHSEQLAALAVRHGVPAFYKGREFVAAGGLAAYGSEITNSIAWPATIPAEFSRARNLPICRFSVRQKSS